MILHNNGEIWWAGQRVECGVCGFAATLEGKDGEKRLLPAESDKFKMSCPTCYCMIELYRCEAE